jgi:tetratricopeptide (TPR) repeat protein
MKAGATAAGLVLSLTGSAWACLWYYGTDLHGKEFASSTWDPKTYISRFTDHSEHGRRQRLRMEGPTPGLYPGDNYKARSDMATTLVYKGETGKAIEIFKEIEKEQPNEYVVAANLGTAYELHGDLVSAKQWISEAIRRNPNSHYGTEWLHVLILDARMALAKDPKWLETHSVLGVDFGKDPAPRKPAAWPVAVKIEGAAVADRENARATVNALEYQLHERMGFVPPPDPVVGDLLCDLGNVLATTSTIEHAIVVYDLALTYKPLQADLIAARRAHLQEVVDTRRRWEELKKLAWYGGAGLLMIALIGLWIRQRATSAQ